MQSVLNSWNSTTKLIGSRERIEDVYEAVSISIDISGSATLKCLWGNVDSSNPNNFNDYGDTFSVEDLDFNFIVVKKAKYFYVKIENPIDLTKLVVSCNFLKNSIKTSSSVSGVNAVICYGKNDVGTDLPLRIDGDGKLIVTGSGGGGGGDATAANQLLELAELQELNTKLTKCDTDNVIIDSSTPVNVLNLARVENTLNNAFLTVDSSQNLKVTVANQNDISTLATQETLAEIKTELTSHMPTLANQELIGEYVNNIQSLMLNVDYTQGYADIYTDAQTLGADTNPSFTVHPTLDGWYYSNSVSSGASNLYFYANSGGQQKQHKVSELYSSYVTCNILNLSNSANLPFLVVYSKPTGTNDYAPWYHSKWIYKLPSSSLVSAGQEILMFQGGQPTQQILPHIARYEAVLVETFGEGNKAAEDLLYCTVNTDSAATINTTKVVYTNVGYDIMGRNHLITLGVGKQQQTRDIKDKIDNLSSIVGAGVFVQLDSNVNGLKLKSTLNDGSADVNVRNDINVNNLTKCDTDNVIIQSGSVNSHIVDAANSPLTFTNVGLKNTADVYVNNNSLDVHCYGSSDGTIFHHLKTNPSGVLSTNAIIESNNGALTSTVDDDINALDVSVKNIVGTDLRSNVNGYLTSTSLPGATGYNALDVVVKSIPDVNSNLKTVVGGDLTSTISGTGNSVHSLDVYLQNPSVVTKSQPTSSSLVVTNEYCYCSGPTDSKVLGGGLAVSTSGFLYASCLFTITGFSMSGWANPNIYIQSGDGTTWFNESSNSVSANGTFKITVYSTVVLPYLRLYLDCSSITTPNNVSFTISSATIFQK